MVLCSHYSLDTSKKVFLLILAAILYSPERFLVLVHLSPFRQDVLLVYSDFFLGRGWRSLLARLLQRRFRKVNTSVLKFIQLLSYVVIHLTVFLIKISDSVSLEMGTMTLRGAICDINKSLSRWDIELLTHLAWWCPDVSQWELSIYNCLYHISALRDTFNIIIH